MDWTPQTATSDSEIINALMSRMTHGLVTLSSPYGLRNHHLTDVTRYTRIRQPKQPLGLKNNQRTDSMGDAWIGQPKEPLGTQKLSKN
jgi:hypothetical protein